MPVVKGSATPVPFVRTPQPILEGGSAAYVQVELGKVEAAIRSTQRMTPQPAYLAPEVPLDGMIRLSRKPWRPVAAQTVDKWVYYDGVGRLWRLLATDPTNSP